MQKYSDIEEGTNIAGTAHSNYQFFYYHYETQNNWVLMNSSYQNKTQFIVDGKHPLIRRDNKKQT